MALGALELAEDDLAELGRRVRARRELARVDVEPVRLLLAALHVEDQLPRRLADRELRERPHVGSGHDRRAVSLLAPVDERQQRLPVRLASGQSCELEQRRHEVDRAHLRVDHGGLEATRRGEDQRHLDDLVEERRAVHVVHALHLVLRGEPLAPRLAVVGEEREGRALAEPERVELLEERGDEHLRLALDRLPVALAHRLERRRGVGLDALDDLLLRGQPVLAVGMDDVVGHVRRPVVDVEKERCVPVRAQPLECAVERLARPEDVRLGQVLEEVVRVEDEARDLVAVRGERAEERLDRGIELGVPVEVAVMVGVHARDDRGRRRRSPRRGADRVREADAARRQLVDRARVHVPGAVAAEVVRAQRIGDVDDDVHSAPDCSDGPREASYDQWSSERAPRNRRGHRPPRRLTSLGGAPRARGARRPARPRRGGRGRRPVRAPGGARAFLGAGRRRARRGVHVPETRRTCQCPRASSPVCASTARRRSCFPSTTRATATARSSSRASGARVGRSSSGTWTRSRSSLTALPTASRCSRSSSRRVCSSAATATSSSIIEPSRRSGSHASSQAALILCTATCARSRSELEAWPTHWLATSGIDLRDREPLGATHTIAELVAAAGEGRVTGRIHGEVIRLIGTAQETLVVVDDGTSGHRRLVPGGNEPLGAGPQAAFRVRGHDRGPGRQPRPTSTRSTLRSRARRLRGISRRRRRRRSSMARELEAHRPAAVASDVRPLD